MPSDHRREAHSKIRSSGSRSRECVVASARKKGSWQCRADSRRFCGVLRLAGLSEKCMICDPGRGSHFGLPGRCSALHVVSADPMCEHHLLFTTDACPHQTALVESHDACSAIAAAAPDLVVGRMHHWVFACRICATRRAAGSHCRRNQALQREAPSACASFNITEICNA
jgi:hypothetical protein